MDVYHLTSLLEAKTAADTMSAKRFADWWLGKSMEFRAEVSQMLDDDLPPGWVKTPHFAYIPLRLYPRGLNMDVSDLVIFEEARQAAARLPYPQFLVWWWGRDVQWIRSAVCTLRSLNEVLIEIPSWYDTFAENAYRYLRDEYP